LVEESKAVLANSAGTFFTLPDLVRMPDAADTATPAGHGRFSTTDRVEALPAEDGGVAVMDEVVVVVELLLVGEDVSPLPTFMLASSLILAISSSVSSLV